MKIFFYAYKNINYKVSGHTESVLILDNYNFNYSMENFFRYFSKQTFTNRRVLKFFEVNIIGVK